MKLPTPLRMHALAALWFVALAGLITYPLVHSLDTHVTGATAGDNLASVWNFWWARHVLATDGLDYFRTGHLFAPSGISLVLNTNTALEAWIGATALAGLPTLRAHNVVLLGGLAANGFSAYLLAYAFARQTWPSIMAGTAFATSAYVSIHLVGHFNLVHAWVVPLALLAWVSLLEAPSVFRAAVAGVAFTVAAYSDYYYFVFASISAAVWLGVTATDAELAWRPERFRRTRRVLLSLAGLSLAMGAAIRITSGMTIDVGSIHISATQARNPVSFAGLCLLAWVVLQTTLVVRPVRASIPLRRMVPFIATTLAVGLVLSLPLAAEAVSLIRSGSYVSQQYFWRSSPRGVDLVTTIGGNPMQTFTGTWTRAADERLGIDYIEQTAWLGVIPTLLLIAAVRFRRSLLPSARPLLWLAAFFFVWSLGPSLAVAGRDTGILLPQALTRYVPVVSNARIPGRAIIVVQLAVAVLGALVISGRRWTVFATSGLTALLVLENLVAPYPLSQVPEADAVDLRLNATSRAAVIELPSGIRDGFGEWGRFDHRALIHQMTHERPLVGGFVARVAPSLTQRYREDRAVSALFDVSEEAIEAGSLPADLGSALAASGIDSVVVNTDRLRAPLRIVLEQRGLHFVMSEGTRELYSTERTAARQQR